MTASMTGSHRTHIPTHGHTPIRRTRLLDALTDTLLDPTTGVTAAMLTAPVGSGKTMLLTDWASRSDTCGVAPVIAWLTVTDDDNDPGVLAESVLAALRATAAPGVVAALADLAVTPVGGATFLPAVADVLGAVDETVVLVLDDVHRLHDHDTLDALGGFLRWMPPALRAVLSARYEPPLTLHRLRLEGRVRDLSADELAFTRNEAAALLAEHRVVLTPADLITVQNRTQGWAAGLRLAAITLAHHDDPHAMIADFGGDNRVVADYLVGEVLDRLDPDARDFLVETSVPDAFNVDLAETLTGRPDAYRFIALVERENLLVEHEPGAPGWYRYHPLLREYLRAEASHRGRCAITDLERIASCWFARSGADVRALRHALLAGDETNLQNQLTGLGFGAVLRGHGDVVADVLAHAPAGVRNHPASRLVRAAAELDRGNEAAATSALGAGWPRGLVTEPDLPAWAGQLAVGLRLDLAVRTGGLADALAAATTESVGRSGDPCVDAFVLIRLGAAETCLGRFDDATRHLNDGLSVARSAEVPVLEVQALAFLALVASCRCRLDEVTAWAAEAVAVAAAHDLSGHQHTRLAEFAAAWAGYLRMEPGGIREDLLPALTENVPHAMAAVVAVAVELAHPDEFDSAGSARTADDHLRSAWRHPLPRAATALLAPPVHRALLDAGLPSGAADLSDRVARTLGPASAEPAVLAAVTALYAGRADAARAHLAPVLEGTLTCVVPITDVLAWLTAAQVADLKKQPIRVRDALSAALAIAAPERMVRPFATIGIRELLDRNRGRFGTLDPFADTILHLVPAATGPVDNPLTAREMELLVELPSWRTADQIAADLYVSVNTVKTHLRGIYRKLEVTSRRDAIAAARNRGLL